MIVEPDYKGFRIEVNAVAVDGRWNADVMIRRTLSREKPSHHTVSCLKLRPDLAEYNAEIWAKRWIDVQLRVLRVRGDD